MLDANNENLDFEAGAGAAVVNLCSMPEAETAADGVVAKFSVDSMESEFVLWNKSVKLLRAVVACEVFLSLINIFMSVSFCFCCTDDFLNGRLRLCEARLGPKSVCSSYVILVSTGGSAANGFRYCSCS